MNSPTLHTISELSIDDVNSFLLEEFPSDKAQFLINHGDWLHKGNENRFALELGGKIIGYFGIIPTKVIWKGEKKEAFWWIDLIISKSGRGKGYQTIVDDYIRNRSELKLGFPNKFAAGIHRKHNWKVYNHLKVMLLPIIPSKSSIFKKKKSQTLGKILDNIFGSLIKLGSNYSTQYAQKESNPNFKEYADLFNSRIKSNTTTMRDESFFIWRYDESPFKRDYMYYSSKKRGEPHIILIARKKYFDQGLSIRIIDVIGNINDKKRFIDLVKLVISDSISLGANQITVLETNTKLQFWFLLCGFIIFTKARFCFYPDLGNENEHPINMSWSFVDSDNDFLD